MVSARVDVGKCSDESGQVGGRNSKWAGRVGYVQVAKVTIESRVESLESAWNDTARKETESTHFDHAEDTRSKCFYTRYARLGSGFWVRRSKWPKGEGKQSESAREGTEDR
jgi:hypothetical protein